MTGVQTCALPISPGFKRRIEISGEKGTIILDGDSISTWLIEGEEPAQEASEQLTDGSNNPAAIATEGHRRQIEDMMQAVFENREPVVNGAEGRTSLEVVEALYQSAASQSLITL